MKERLIGDDQLLVTADTTMGDALWDWVAADAARRAPDGWRIANLGAVPTSLPQPVAARLRLPAGRRRRRVLDPLPPVSGAPEPEYPETRTTPTRPSPRRAARPVRPDPRPPAAEARPLRPRVAGRGPRRGRHRPRRLDRRRRAAVRHADDRLAPRRPAVLARLVGEPDAARDRRRHRGVRHGHAARRLRARALRASTTRSTSGRRWSSARRTS